MTKGFMIAAPNSGAGKTTLTVGLLAALRAKGVDVTSAKSGPDYIDGRFHKAVTGQPCFNLDAWAMTEDRLRGLAQTERLLVVEAAMGLFDGAPPNGQGSAADLASSLGIPAVLVVDASRQSQSIAALVHGFASFREHPKVGGVILNRVSSLRHEQMLCHALAPLNIPVIGAVPNTANLHRPSRHLGLVQAVEQSDLSKFIGEALNLVTQHLDLDMLVSLSNDIRRPAGQMPRLAPPAQHIAIARDAAFDFFYDHFVHDWNAQGAELSFFSPLNDDAPPPADLVFLPGGYPELHAGKLAANSSFLNGLRASSRVYGECGGYMVMGETLTDEKGQTHKMAGLLRLETSFEKPRRHLGYRKLSPKVGGPWSGPINGHEFHYASTIKALGDPLFTATDSEGTSLPPMGLINKNHSGSFAHVIDAQGSQA